MAYRTSPYRGKPPLLTPALVVDAIVLRRGSILLIRRGRPPWQGWWALPGGFVEIGETCEHAVARELREETGLRGRVLRLVGVYSAPDRDPRAHIISVAYRLSAVRGAALGGDDAAAALWFPVRRIPRLAADHRQIVRDALRSEPATRRISRP